MERWSETKKRECDSSPDETPKRKRNNGSDTVNFLREKLESEIELRKSELELKGRNLNCKEKEKIIPIKEMSNYFNNKVKLC